MPAAPGVLKLSSIQVLCRPKAAYLQQCPRDDLMYPTSLENFKCFMNSKYRVKPQVLRKPLVSCIIEVERAPFFSPSKTRACMLQPELSQNLKKHTSSFFKAHIIFWVFLKGENLSFLNMSWSRVLKKPSRALEKSGLWPLCPKPLKPEAFKARL